MPRKARLLERIKGARVADDDVTDDVLGLAQLQRALHVKQVVKPAFHPAIVELRVVRGLERRVASDSTTSARRARAARAAPDAARGNMGKKAKSTSFKGQRVTPAGKRFLEERAPKLRENPKKLLALRGSKTSERTSSALQTLAALKSPFCKALSRRREDLRPFEDATAVEGLAARHDCSLFVVGSHSKKRPHNLVFGRTHDGHLLDMFEFGVVEAGGGHGYAKLVGSKPLLSFVGEWVVEIPIIGIGIG